MKLGQRLLQADAIQQGLRFKIAATIAVVLLVIGAFIAIYVAANAPGATERLALRAAERAEQAKGGLIIEKGPMQTIGIVLDSLQLTIKPIESSQPEGAAARPTSNSGAIQIAGLFGVVALAAVAVIWLGLGLSYLALLILGWGIAWPLMLWDQTEAVGQLLLAAVPLVLMFLTGMALLKLALSGSNPVLAVARNLLQEAVRMKISLVFIVMLILLLSYIPGALNENQPLRYRVQQWLQYGTGLSYTILAMLTLFLSVATVAFEQRDKVIWQTMTKPVAPWQYLAGKWIGVMGINAVLLTVTAGGVFLFTEYLRHQPAQGEMAYNVRDDGVTTLGQPDLMTDDRRQLESQVLVARRSRITSSLHGPELMERAIEERIQRMIETDQSVRDTPALRKQIQDEMEQQRLDRILAAVDERIADIRARDPLTEDSTRLRYETEMQFLNEQEALYRTIAPGTAKIYFMTGLIDAIRPNAPPKLTLRYRINAGSNDPSQIYRVRFILNGAIFERQVALGASQTLLFDKELIDETGSMVLEVQSSSENPRELSFPPGGLEVLFVAGGYEANFFRVMAAMWVKLAFTAAVGLAAATFLSFPVACLVALTVLFAAESAGYLAESLEYYVSATKDGIDYLALVVRIIAVPISRIFKVYADLSPTANLVDGRLVSWSSLFSAIGIIGGWAIAAITLGWAIFRQRELATYSGR